MHYMNSSLFNKFIEILFDDEKDCIIELLDKKNNEDFTVFYLHENIMYIFSKFENIFYVKSSNRSILQKFKIDSSKNNDIEYIKNNIIKLIDCKDNEPIKFSVSLQFTVCGNILCFKFIENVK